MPWRPVSIQLICDSQDLGGVLAELGWDIQDYFLIVGLVLMIAAIAVAFIQFNDKPASKGVGQRGAADRSNRRDSQSAGPAR